MLRANRVQDSISKNCRLKLTYSHYKDTYDLHLGNLKERNFLFYILLGVTATFSLQAASPEFVNSALTDYLANATGIKVSKDSRLLDSLLWFLLFGISTRYFQLAVRIEREYKYLHDLESQLNKYFPGTSVFTREGTSYLGSFPTFYNWIWILYTIAFPALLLWSIAVRISLQLASTPQISLIAFDLTCGFLVVLSAALYLGFLHQSWIESLALKVWRRVTKWS